MEIDILKITRAVLGFMSGSLLLYMLYLRFSEPNVILRPETIAILITLTGAFLGVDRLLEQSSGVTITIGSKSENGNE